MKFKRKNLVDGTVEICSKMNEQTRITSDNNKFREPIMACDDEQECSRRSFRMYSRKRVL